MVLALTGPHLVHVYDTELAACRASGGQSTICNYPVTGLFAGLQVALNTVVLLVPALLGMFWGAPLIARELETGTFRLAWTQSVTRLRWLLVKMGLVGLAAMVVAGGLSLMSTWWFSPLDKVTQNRFSPAAFGLHGFVPAGYALFAFALGAAVGLLVRRTLPAMAITLVGFIAVRVVVAEWIRPHFMSPATTSVPLGQAGAGFQSSSPGSPLTVVASAPNLPNALVSNARVVNAAGQAPTACDRQDDVSRSRPGATRGLPAEHLVWRGALRRSHLGPERLPTRPTGLQPVPRPDVSEVPPPGHVSAGQSLLDLPDHRNCVVRGAVGPLGRRVRVVDPASDPMRLALSRGTRRCSG